MAVPFLGLLLTARVLNFCFCLKPSQPFGDIDCFLNVVHKHFQHAVGTTRCFMNFKNVWLCFGGRNELIIKHAAFVYYIDDHYIHLTDVEFFEIKYRNIILYVPTTSQRFYSVSYRRAFYIDILLL